MALVSYLQPLQKEHLLVAGYVISKKDNRGKEGLITYTGD
jgi:hypothetical protein